MHGRPVGVRWRLVTTLVCGLLFWPGAWLTSDAAQQSAVQVSLTPNDDDNAVAPVDPDDPSRPYPGDDHDTGNVTGTGSRGLLTIDYVSNLKFATVAAQTGATSTAQNERAMIQISDRRFNGAGWTLQVTPSSLQSETRALNTSLKLGTLQLRAGAGNVSHAPQVVAPAELTVGTTNNVLVADEQAGLGTWLLLLNRGTTKTTLTVNDTQVAPGEYTGTLAWSLTNAPN